MFHARRHGCRYLEFSAKGNQFLTMENDLIKVVFWLNKGADIVELRYKPLDIDLMWRSAIPIYPVSDYISPAHAPIGHYFDYYHGGWQEVFPNAHLPTLDYKNAPLGLHGEVCLLPWSYEVLTDTDGELSIEMVVRTVRTPFLLKRVVTIESGSPSLRFHETIVNESPETMHFSWGHHPVFGPPFVQEGCVIDVPEHAIVVFPEGGQTATSRYTYGQRVTWPNATSVDGKRIDASLILGEHTHTTDSFYLEMNEGWAVLRNPMLDVGVGLVWEPEVFPYLWIWQAYCGSQGYPFYGRNYNVAIEPFSVPIETLTQSVASGSATVLKAGESISTEFLCQLFSGQKKVRYMNLLGKIEH